MAAAFVRSCNAVRSLPVQLLSLTSPLANPSLVQTDLSFASEASTQDNLRVLLPDGNSTFDSLSAQHQLQVLLDSATCSSVKDNCRLAINHECLNTISALHTGAWLWALPNPSLGFAMPPRVYCGTMFLARNSFFPSLSSTALHAVTSWITMVW